DQRQLYRSPKQSGEVTSRADNHSGKEMKIRRSGSLLQQRSDQRAFLRQERFGSKDTRIVPGAVFVAVCRQDGCANCHWAWRLNARYPWFADCCQRILVPAQTKTRQAECCSGHPVPRLLSDKHLSFALRCFRCAIRSAEQ